MHCSKCKEFMFHYVTDIKGDVYRMCSHCGLVHDKNNKVFTGFIAYMDNKVCRVVNINELGLVVKRNVVVKLAKKKKDRELELLELELVAEGS